MATKTNPIIHRIPTTKTWFSRWFAGDDRKYASFLEQDVRIRKWLKGKLKDAGVDHIEITRSHDQFAVNIHTSKPGVVIGRGGAGVEDIKKQIKSKFIKNDPINLQINIKEIGNPQLSASIMAQNIAQDIERRLPFRRSIKRALDQIMKAGAQGAKIEVKGRLNGAEIARKERVQSGNVPLQTIRADIDYSRCPANTTYGVIGVKVWIYKGEVFNKDKKEENKK